MNMLCLYKNTHSILLLLLSVMLFNTAEAATAQTFMWMAEDNIVEVSFDKEHLLETSLSPNNLNEAYKSVLKYIRGWVGYYHLANMKRLLQETDECLRRRIRMCIWKACPPKKTRIGHLVKCGVKEYNPRQ